MFLPFRWAPTNKKKSKKKKKKQKKKTKKKKKKKSKATKVGWLEETRGGKKEE
jgi:hypothetical protein